MTLPIDFEKYECDTPTHTSVAEDSTSDSSSVDCPSTISDMGLFNASPWNGGLYIIRDPKSGLAIALKEGTLGLFPDVYYRGSGGRWRCVENDRLWLGFKNAVSGAYIGHNNRGGFVAEAKSHDGWEWFCARQHPYGGYVLLVKHWSGFLPMKIGGKDNKELVVDAEREGGTAWEFIRVDTGLELYRDD